MFKKFKVVSVVLLFFIMFSLTTIYANESNTKNKVSKKLLDIGTYETMYKLSEDSDITIPFLRLFNDKAVYDKDITTSGFTVAAKSLEITENVTGVQKIICADTVTIDGSIEYGYIIAQNVVINGTVNKDLAIAASSVFVTETANIKGNIEIAAQTADIKGNIEGSLIAICSEITLKTNVAKDLRISSDAVNIENTEDINVGRDIYIETSSEINVGEKYPNATIVKIEKEDTKTASVNKGIKWIDISEIIVSILIYTLIYMLISKTKPNMITNLTNKVKSHSTFTILIGVAALITIPIVLMILMLLSIFGLGTITLPIFIIYSAIIILAIVLAKLVTGIVICEILTPFAIKNDVKFKSKKIGLFMIVLVAIYLLCNIPVISSYAKMATVLFSTGIIITGITKKVITTTNKGKTEVK